MYKNFVTIPIVVLTLISYSFSQCPESPLKFQGPVCESPSNQGIKKVDCSILEVKWNGSNDNTYTVEVSYLDPATKEIIRTLTSGIDVSCIGSGQCNANIPVKEGDLVNWSIQAICKNSINSDVVEGKEVAIPYCEEPAATIHVYPNPNTGNMTVEYMSINSGMVHFKVYDMQGKMVFNKIEKAEAGINKSYKFDLTHLVPGIYLLEASSGSSFKSIKFIIE